MMYEIIPWVVIFILCIDIGYLLYVIFEDRSHLETRINELEKRLDDEDDD